MAAVSTATQAAPQKKGRARKQLIWRAVSFALVIAIFFYVVPQVADLSAVWRTIRAMTALELAGLVAVAAWNLLTYGFVITSATPGLSLRQSLVATEASTAVANTVPAGSAWAVGLTYAMFGSWGFSKSRTSVSLVITGLWNNFAKLGMPVLALALLAFQGKVTSARVVAGTFGIAALLVSIALFALILRSDQFARRAGDAAGRFASKLTRPFHKPPASGWGDATSKFRSRVIGIVERRWIRLTAWTLVSHFSLFAVLVVALRSVGVSNLELSWAEVLAVFAFVRLLTAVPLTPGGLGIVELGLIGGLSKAGGNHEEVVAAVLVFRSLTYVAPIFIGLATYLFWRRNKSWLNSAPPLDQAFQVAPAK